MPFTNIRYLTRPGRTFGKFVVFKRGIYTLAMRVSSTTNPIEIVRLT